MKFIILVLFTLQTALIFAQSYTKVYKTQFTHLEPFAVTHTEQNGPLIIGLHNDDAFALRVDENGEILWMNGWSSPVNNFPRFDFNQVIPVADSNFIIAGSLANDSLMRKTTLLMKLDQDGTLLWKQEFNQEGTGLFHHSVVIETPDSGYILGWGAFYTGGAFGLAKLDVDGNVAWKRTHISANNVPSTLVDIVQIDNSSYLLAGNLDNSPNPMYDGFLAAVNENGDLLWSKKYPGMYIHDIEINNGVLAMAGINFQYPLPFFTLGDLNGNFSWDRRAPDDAYINYFLDSYMQIISLSDSTFLLLSGDDEDSGYISKIDADGNIITCKSVTPMRVDVMRTNQGGALMVGEGPISGISAFDSHIGTLRVDSELNIPNCGQDFSASLMDLSMPPADTLQWNNGAVPTLANQAIYPSFVSTLASSGCVDLFGAVAESSTALDFLVYPSISDGTFTMQSEAPEVSLYFHTASGQQVKHFDAVHDQEFISLSECENGLYYYTALTPDGRRKTGTLILQK